ncbi:MAG: hypothetical protein H6760_01850 [Candidatus Nomurabacteria bacterium]|nr:MAG: hypothetical protein H6760_01850 [Candidatus Nomurabacteria bacterium]
MSSKASVPNLVRQSQLFGTTLREAPRGEESINARLLEQGAFIRKHMAGAYSYLPLGLRVLRKIETIIREEMNAVDGQEVLMPALQPKELWDKTGRWEGLKPVMYQFLDHSEKHVGLGVTHEEVIAELARQFVKSYKDLPVALYQIQTKFRHEARPKSGLNRGREFSMKDLYSLHTSEDDMNAYYERVKTAYLNVFTRCGLDAKIVEASGGDFTKEYSHEFQVLTEAGEDHIFYCPNCTFAQNKEIAKVKEGNPCPNNPEDRIQISRAIEVGNIFKLGTKYSDGIGAHFVNEEGKKMPIIMASYGIGVSRLIGTIVEVHNDEKGIRWPLSVAPFDFHVVQLGNTPEINSATETLITLLLNAGKTVLYDDRNASAGEKLNDSDLLGIPYRLLVSAKTGDKVEVKKRDEKDSQLLSPQDILHTLSGEKG